MKLIRRNLKLIMGLYAALVIAAASVALVACKDKLNESELYKFSESKFDVSPNYEISEIKELYNNGLTLKRFNNEDYFVINPNYSKPIKGIESLKFGPLTTDSLNYSFKFDEVDSINQEYRISVTIPLISKLKGTINYTRFNISWVTYNSQINKCEVIELTPVEINFVNGLKYNKTTTLNVFWTTSLNKIKNFNIYLCIEAINYTKDGNFREVMTFDINRFK